MHIQFATTADIPSLHPIIERAYRGDEARKGWTFESDLLTDPRSDIATLEAILADPNQRLLIGKAEDDTPIGCVNIMNVGQGTAYLGLLCIDPLRQASGRGRLLLKAAEYHAAMLFHATVMEMTVIDSRSELINWYIRRGYAYHGVTRPFPIELTPPLTMVVLTKSLEGRNDLR